MSEMGLVKKKRSGCLCREPLGMDYSGHNDCSDSVIPKPYPTHASPLQGRNVLPASSRCGTMERLHEEYLRGLAGLLFHGQ